MQMENLTGQTLGQYELRELLGTGGMGAVYRGYQRTLRRDVAVKVLYTTLAMQTEYGERFVREAQTAAALEHAHIVPIYDYGTERGLSYVVMRLLTGGSLAERIEYSNESGRPLPGLAEVVTITTHLASAMDYAHSQGVIHRDIKDKNVMFDNQGTVFLVDFGIAKLMSMSGTSGLTHTGATVGTPWYMAPEQWRGDPVTPAVDQYALGVTVYVMLTGKMPFEAETPYQLMHKHLNEPIIPIGNWREDLPADIGAVLVRALHKEPGERYPKVSDFAQDLAKAVSNRPGITMTTGFFTTPLPTKAPLVTPPSQISNVEERTQIEPHVAQTPPPMQASQSGAVAAPPVPVTRSGPPLWAVAAIVVALLAGIVVGAAVILPMVQRTPEPTGAGVAVGPATATDTSVPPTEPPDGQQVEAIPPEPATGEPTEAPTEPQEAQVLPTEAPTDTPEPSATDVPPSETPGPTDEPVEAVEPLPTSQVIVQAVEPTATETPEPTATLTETPLPTDTSVPPTATATATETPTLTATATLTVTPEPSATPIPPTATRLPTDTPTATLTPTLTATVTPSETPIPPTATRRPSDTPVPSATFTPTLTETATATATFTPTESPTSTFTPTATATITDEPPSTPTACQVADLNQSGAVDIFDIRLLTRAYDSVSGDELYDARLDFDGSGTINVLDLRRVTSQFGQTCEARG